MLLVRRVSTRVVRLGQHVSQEQAELWGALPSQFTVWLLI